MKRFPLAAVLGSLCLMLASGVAQAQLYHYKDASGRMVYSDTPPPPGIPAANILKAPKVNQASPAAAPTAAGADGKDAKKDGPKSTADREADYKKRMAEADKKGKEDATKAANEKTRQDNCASARSNLAALQNGQRMRKLDANGNPYFVEDAERNADISKAQQQLADGKC